MLYKIIGTIALESAEFVLAKFHASEEILFQRHYSRVIQWTFVYASTDFINCQMRQTTMFLYALTQVTCDNPTKCHSRLVHITRFDCDHIHKISTKLVTIFWNWNLPNEFADVSFTFIVSPCIFVHLVLSPTYALIYIIKILSQAIILVALFTPTCFGPYGSSSGSTAGPC